MMNDDGHLQRSDFIKRTAYASLGGMLSATGIAAAQELRKVNILAVPTDGVKSTLYAQKAGLFRKHGIQADIVPMGSGAAIFAAVLGGAADIGSGSLFPVFAAHNRGVPLRIVAPASLYTSDRADALLVVQKDSPLKTGRDLNGKTIGTDAIKDVYSTATRAWVDMNGGDGASLKALELKPTEQVAALDAGRIDVVVLKSPYLQAALATNKFRVLGKPLDAIAPRFLLSCWVAGVDFIAKNPDVISGYQAALSEAARYTNANQNATTDMVAAFTGQESAVLAKGIRSVTAETLTIADVQKPLDFAVKYGIIDKTFDVNGILASSVPRAH
jgi:NitT/TauT family transport system substrate-binding protein